MYSPDQRHDIRLLAALRGVSYLGDAVALVALYLRLAPQGHAWAIAALSVAGTLPLVVLAPVAGHVADRARAKVLLVALGLGESVVCVGLGRWHSMSVTLTLMVMLSSMIAFSLPGYSALVPAIAGPDNIARSQSLMQAVLGGANVLGPFLGGLLVGSLGQSWPLYADALSLASAAVATTLLRHDRRPSPSSIESVASVRMLDGVTQLWNDRLLRPIVLSVMAFFLSIGMTNVAEVFFATRTLHASPTLYGMIGASFGLGTVGGALFARRLSQDTDRLARSVLEMIVVVGATIGAVGLVTRVGYIYPLMAIAGLAAGVAQVAAMTLFTVRTPEALRGRMYAAVGAVFTASQIGATAAGGLILTVFAPRTVFQIGGIGATLSALAFGPYALRASVGARRRERDGQGE